MMKRLFAVLLAVVAGCGDADRSAPVAAKAAPATDLLPVGARVLLVAEDVDFEGRPSTSMTIELEDPLRKGAILEGGTEARVVRDVGPAGDPARKVTVHVLSGIEAGVTGRVERGDCHPLK